MKPDDQNMRVMLAEFADSVIADDNVQRAADFLSFNYSKGDDWQVASFFLSRLLKRMTLAQAPKISHLLDEFMPLNTPFWELKKLHDMEESRYNELRCAWGIARCMYWQAGQTPEGRTFLKQRKGRC